jgi:hypothetical protein
MWEEIADFVLREVRERMASPQRRKGVIGGFKRESYRLNDTGSLSDSLGTEVIQFGDQVQIALTYPNTGDNNIKAKIFFETGRKPGVGVNIENLRGWATRKLPGFAGLTEEQKTFRLIRISMSIKQKGIGTYPIFDPSFTNELEQKYLDWFNQLTDEQIEQLPGIQQVFEVFRNIRPFDEATIELFQ